MTPPSTADVERAVRAAWTPQTTYAKPAFLARGAGRPSRGQCGPTALVVHDLLGGELLVAEVSYEGERDGVHYWNRLPDGRELDLTRDQFVAGEVLSPPQTVQRGETADPAAEVAYRLLLSRVRAVLG